MTQISVKIGRFICDSAIVDDKHRLLQQSGSRRGHKVTRIVHHDDDVIPGMTSSSTGDLQGLNMTSRNLSLPDFHCWDFGNRGGGGGGGGEDGLERSTEEEMESSSFGGKKDWMDEYYNRTILAHDNDLHVSHLFRAFYLGEGRQDESICNEEDEEEERKEAEAAAAAAAAALPWRSTEQMDAVEDTSKYLLRDNDDDVDPLATPRVENVEMDDDQRGPRLDPPHHHHHHSPSQSSSSSFRNAALSCGRDGGGSSTRPELSNCQSLASLSHWLSEAESRHSEPFCPQHHHVLDATAASSSMATAADPSSIRSSIDRSRFVGRQMATAAAAAAGEGGGGGGGGGECCNVAADALMQTNDHQSSSSDGATSAEGVWPVVIATTDDDDDWTMSRHEQVLLWLMSNDLTEKGMEEEEEEDKEEDEEVEVVERRQGPSPSTFSATSIDHLPRHQLIISCTH